LDKYSGVAWLSKHVAWLKIVVWLGKYKDAALLGRGMAWLRRAVAWLRRVVAWPS